MMLARKSKAKSVSVISVLLVISTSIAAFAFFSGNTLAASVEPEINGVNDWTEASNGLPSVLSYNTVFGDFNNDGKLDVTYSGLRVFIGDGNGNWVEQSTGLGGEQFDMDKGDLDNDGNLDLVVGGGIYTGNGGAGGSMVWTPQNSPGPWNGVALGDVNNDGKLDLVTTPGAVKVYTGNGAVPFVWTDSSGSLPSADNFWGVALGDINNDGKLDIVAANNSGGIRAWTGNGGTGPGAVWTEATGTGLPSTGSHTGIDLGDVNNDGKLDIAVGLQGGGVRIYTGNGGGGGFVWTDNSTGLDTTGQFYQVVLGDINRDGNLDLVGACEFCGIRVWEGNGGAGGSMLWTSAQNALPITGQYIDVNLGDANNDGKLDISGALSTGTEVWLNNYPDFTITGFTSISTNLPTSGNWYDIVFGDINSDGKLDLAVSSASNQGVRVYTGDGTGLWTSASTGLPTTGTYNGLRFADVDHNGTLDLVGSMNGGGGTAVKVWYGNGAGSWTETSLVTPTEFGAGVEVIDVNHDGNKDIITCHYLANNNVYVFLGDGAGGWGLNAGPSETNGYDDIALGDVNHDGDIDLISTTMTNGVETRFWLGDGTGSSWSLQSPGIPTSEVYLGAALEDVNHDGNLDAAIAGFGPGNGMRVWTSDGGAGGPVVWTEESTGLPTINDHSGVEFGDLDGCIAAFSSDNWSVLGDRFG
jgi:hypothetical protein